MSAGVSEECAGVSERLLVSVLRMVSFSPVVTEIRVNVEAKPAMLLTPGATGLLE